MNRMELHKVANMGKLKAMAAGSGLGMVGGMIPGYYLGIPIGIAEKLMGADREDANAAMLAPLAGLGLTGALAGALLGYKMHK
jgi:hypothetical protein